MPTFTPGRDAVPKIMRRPAVIVAILTVRPGLPADATTTGPAPAAAAAAADAEGLKSASARGNAKKRRAALIELSGRPSNRGLSFPSKIYRGYVRDILIKLTDLS